MKAWTFLNYWGRALAAPWLFPKVYAYMSVAMAFKTAFCLYWEVARKTFEGSTSGAFLLILGEFLGTLG